MIPIHHFDRPYMPGGHDAGRPMYLFYQDANVVFPLLTDSIDVWEDTPATSWGLAWFYGLDNEDRPRFAVRDDIALNPKIAYHEAGHAFDAIVTKRLTAQGKPWDYVWQRYWQFRGFPGTWQDAQAIAISGSGGASWAYYPAESLAEAFSAAVSGRVESEWTIPYGKDLALVNPGTPQQIYDPTRGAMRARGFFLELMEEVQDDMTPEQDQMLRRLLALAEAREPLVWIARTQRQLDVEDGKTYDPNRAPKDSRIRST